MCQNVWKYIVNEQFQQLGDSISGSQALLLGRMNDRCTNKKKWAVILSCQLRSKCWIRMRVISQSKTCAKMVSQRWMFESQKETVLGVFCTCLWCLNLGHQGASSWPLWLAATRGQQQPDDKVMTSNIFDKKQLPFLCLIYCSFLWDTHTWLIKQRRVRRPAEMLMVSSNTPLMGPQQPLSRTMRLFTASERS